MALSAAFHYETVGQTRRIAGKLKASTTFYKGAILCFDANGFLAITGGAATDIPAGVFTGFGVTPGSASITVGAAAVDGEVEQGLVWVPFSGAAQTKVGELFYLTSDDTLTQTAGTNTFGLLCVGFKTGFVLVDFLNPVKVA
jgi:hypothetical protein